MRTLKFTKMQGAGNDFVMLDGIRQDIEPTPALIRYLADRRFGIGADQVLMVERARLPGVDFRYRIFNCDGDEVEQCGNGARCFAVFVREEGLTDKTSIRVETMKAVIEPEVRPDGRVTVNMGPARKAPGSVALCSRRPRIRHGRCLEDLSCASLLFRRLVFRLVDGQSARRDPRRGCRRRSCGGGRPQDGIFFCLSRPCQRGLSAGRLPYTRQAPRLGAWCR